MVDLGKSAKSTSLMNAMDIANRRQSVIGFNESISAEQRVAAIESVISRFPNSPVHSGGHFSAGPKDKRKLAKVSFIEFASEDMARTYLARIGGKGKQFETLHGAVTMKPSETRVNMERAWALRKAEELLKGACKQGQPVKIEFGSKQRGVMVNGTKVFTQGQDDLGGPFIGDYSFLSLP